MALPNSHYSWVYQTLWGIKHLFITLGTRKVWEINVGHKYDTWISTFNETNGPYMMLGLQYTGPTEYNDGMVVNIFVDGVKITSDEGDWDGLVLHTNEQRIGRDGTWQPFVLAANTLEIKTRAKVRGRGEDIIMKVMRLGE